MKTINLSERIKKSEKFQDAMKKIREEYKKGSRILSDETKEKIRKGVKQHYEQHGSNASKSSQKHMEGINRTLSKPIAQYTTEGVFVKEYISIMEAQRISGVKQNNISRSLTKPNRTAGGYIWKYLPKITTPPNPPVSMTPHIPHSREEKTPGHDESSETADNFHGVQE